MLMIPDASRPAILCACLFAAFCAPGTTQARTDWRNITQGHVIPDKAYADQPYLIKTDDGAWLCVMTTADGHEGAESQHIITQRSTDHGQTWTNLVEVEPPEAPEASYAVLLKAPSGRIFVFYNFNADNLREVRGDNPPYAGGIVRRVDSIGAFVFRYSDDHGRTWSRERHTIPVREFEIDRKNVYGGAVRFHWNVGKPFIHDHAAYVPLTKVGGFGEGFFTSNEGVLLRSDNLMTIEDPAAADWETLPDGDVGLRTPQGGGPIAAEQSYSVLSDGSLFCVYRTIDGYPAFSYSRDGGHSWDAPQYLRYANGRLVKHPRAATFAWRCQNGKFLYWFHNHGGAWLAKQPGRRNIGYQDRNPAWLCGGIEQDGPDGKIIVWSQPEIVLYDDDPLIRISYPDLLEDDGRYFISATQKDVARVHEIDTSLLDLLWNQPAIADRATEGLAADWTFDDTVWPASKPGIALEPFYARDTSEADHRGMHVRSGFTVEVTFTLKDLSAGQMLIDTRDPWGKGWALATTGKRSLRLVLSDGRTVSTWDSDADTLVEGRRHQVCAIVDGGPKTILFVTDGLLNDGGDRRRFGWGRFNPFLQDVNGAERWSIGRHLHGQVHRVSFYTRALRVTEAIGNHRASLRAGDAR